MSSKPITKSLTECSQKLQLIWIVDCLQRLSAFEDAAQPLIFSYILPVDIYDLVHKIPGIELPGKPKAPRTDAQRKKQQLLNRIEWRVMMMPFFSGGGVEQAFSGLKI